MGQGQQSHSALGSVVPYPPSSSSHSVSPLPQPSSAFAPLPPSLLSSGAALSPARSRAVHGTEDLVHSEERLSINTFLTVHNMTPCTQMQFTMQHSNKKLIKFSFR